MALPDTRMVELDGTTLAVREWGPPTGRPLVFWHSLGAATSGAMAHETATILAERQGVRTVALDAPGYGASPAVPRGRYGVPALSALLWGAVDRLDLGRPVLMGHSWGGVIVEAAAAVRPSSVSGLVLLDSGHLDYQDLPSFPSDTSCEALVAEASRPERQWRFADRGQLRDGLGDALPRPVTEAMLDAALAGMRVSDEGELVGIPAPEVRAASMAGLCDVRASALWPAIAASRLPILLLLGSEPAELRAQNEASLPAFREALPAAETFFVERAGHGLPIDLPDEVAARIGAWLEQLDEEI
jgi:pimeloyl-ACP methyl ester carboxylesterase